MMRIYEIFNNNNQQPSLTRKGHVFLLNRVIELSLPRAKRQELINQVNLMDDNELKELYRKPIDSETASFQDLYLKVLSTERLYIYPEKLSTSLDNYHLIDPRAPKENI